MPIFGQVWLWSSLAFLLGAVLCWALVALPARRRVAELESQLATRPRRQPAAERSSEQARRKADERDREEDFSRSLVPGLGDRQGDEASEYLTRAYALPRDTPAPPMQQQSSPEDRGRLAPMPEQELPEHEQQTRQQPFSAFDSGLVAPPETPDTELANTPSGDATQYLNVSSGSLAASRSPLEAPPEVPPQSPSDRGWFDDELHGDAAGQSPEEQPARPSRHATVEAPIPGSLDSRLVDDEADLEAENDLDGDLADHTADHTADRMAGHEEVHDEPRPAIDEDDEYDSGGTVFTQRTRPIPGELIRQIDEAGKDEANRTDGFVDDMADDPADDFADDLDDEPGDRKVDRSERTVESEPVEPISGASQPLTSPDPGVPSQPELAQEQTAVVPPTPAPASELPRRIPAKNKMTPGVTVRVEPTPNALPKRVPSKPRHQIPFGVQPKAPEPAPAAAMSEAGAAPEAPRSLFEPIVPAGEGGEVPPPPHRLRQANGAAASGKGPFGPGSAMPLPGGASPSPEFTIKASVAALRYCTPDSPQFGRTVAEVWFRSAADAERVGFRPVG